MKSRLVGATCAAMGMIATSAFGFSTNPLGEAGGWDDVINRPFVTAVVDASDFTSDLPAIDTASALTSAFETWDMVSSASNLDFKFRKDNGGDFDLFDQAGGGRVNVRYANVVMGGFLPESYFTNLDPVNGANILGVTWVTPLTLNASGSVLWNTEIFFNDGWNWTTDSAEAAADFSAGLANKTVDLETVALHELGHAIGFGHEDLAPSVMASGYQGVARTLLADDVNAVTELYGSGSTGDTFQTSSPFATEGNGAHLVDVYYADASALAVPEPGTALLLAASLLAIGGLRKSRTRRPRCSSIAS